MINEELWDLFKLAFEKNSNSYGKMTSYIKDALEKEFKDGNTSWNTFNNKAGTFVHW